MSPSDVEFRMFLERARDAELVELYKVVPLALKIAKGTDLARVFTVLGYLAGCEIRGLFTWSGSRVGNWKFRLWGRFLALGFAMYTLNRLARTSMEVHQWNDFYLVRWLVAGSRDDALQLYWRARAPVKTVWDDTGTAVLDKNSRETKSKALWLIRETRLKFPAFELLMSSFEAVYGSLADETPT